MNFPNFFADADANFDEAQFVIYGVPYDKTSSFRRGAAKAPKAIREAGWNFETYDLRTGIDLREIKVHDYGDLDVRTVRPSVMSQRVTKCVSSFIKEHKFPIALGGEHAITPGIIRAFPRDIAVLSLDAHIDFREEYENEPLNHACVIKRIAEHVDINNIAVVGIRSAEKEEFDHARKQGLFSIDAYAIQDRGMSWALREVKNHLKNKQIYLTLDIDVIDPAYAPGTSTPEPCGLSPRDVLECIEYFSPRLIGCDVVEVCPPYDHGETALLAAKLIRWLIGVVWKNKICVH